MIEGRAIVCIASDWEVDPTSKHHVMRCLAARNRVLWVSHHGSRRPQLNGADFRSVWSALKRTTRGLQRVDSQFGHLTPLVIPGARSRTARRFSERMLIAQIRRGLRQMGVGRETPLQIWTFDPEVDYLAGRFGEERFVYYCVDEYAEFTGVHKARVREAEERLLGRADVVLTSSEALFRSRSARHANVHLVRHGVEVSHFARSVARDLPRPETLCDVHSPVIGFFGLVHDWVDLELVGAVADLLPRVRFVMIGDCRVDVSRLRRLGNVLLLGRRSYEELPAYCASFDAAMLPFKCNELTRNVNPIKLREYLAAGLPVVSTPLPEVLRYSPMVKIAGDAESFARACCEAIETDTAASRLRRSRSMLVESWESVVREIESIVMVSDRAGSEAGVGVGVGRSGSSVASLG
jgi:glycosyltransferase involved in cell wall biosynthesis